MDFDPVLLERLAIDLLPLARDYLRRVLASVMAGKKPRFSPG